MKNRNIPYGYQYSNGIVEINKAEENELKQIIDLYLKGLSLLKIAEHLNNENIEYMPGVIGWNKSRVMRVIEDERYLGNETYPQIINDETHKKLINLKANKNKRKNIDSSAEIFKLDAPVVCSVCGYEMQRNQNIRRKCPQQWVCKNNECKSRINLTDKDLLNKITLILNKVISNTDIISSEKNIKSDLEIIKLENEINRTLDSHKIDKDILRKKMTECVSLKYKAIDSNYYITKRLKADFEKTSLLLSFSAELFSRTVKSVKLNEDTSIQLVLLNGQVIGKEQ